jgi:hypothetical protein
MHAQMNSSFCIVEKLCKVDSSDIIIQFELSMNAGRKEEKRDYHYVRSWLLVAVEVMLGFKAFFR